MYSPKRRMFLYIDSSCAGRCYGFVAYAFLFAVFAAILYVGVGRVRYQDGIKVRETGSTRASSIVVERAVTFIPDVRLRGSELHLEESSRGPSSAIEDVAQSLFVLAKVDTGSFLIEFLEFRDSEAETYLMRFGVPRVIIEEGVSPSVFLRSRDFDSPGEVARSVGKAYAASSRSARRDWFLNSNSIAAEYRREFQLGFAEVWIRHDTADALRFMDANIDFKSQENKELAKLIVEEVGRWDDPELLNEWTNAVQH